MITIELIEALGNEQRVRHRVGEHAVISVVRRSTGFDVEGTCPEHAVAALEHDFQATDWAPIGTMYLWGRSPGLSAIAALAIARGAVAALEELVSTWSSQ